jgi:hypothetical protein
MPLLANQNPQERENHIGNPPSHPVRQKDAATKLCCGVFTSSIEMEACFASTDASSSAMRSLTAPVDD